MNLAVLTCCQLLYVWYDGYASLVYVTMPESIPHHRCIYTSESIVLFPSAPLHTTRTLPSTHTCAHTKYIPDALVIDFIYFMYDDNYTVSRLFILSVSSLESTDRYDLRCINMWLKLTLCDPDLQRTHKNSIACALVLI